MWLTGKPAEREKMGDQHRAPECSDLELLGREMEPMKETKEKQPMKRKEPGEQGVMNTKKTVSRRKMSRF